MLGVLRLMRRYSSYALCADQAAFVIHYIEILVCFRSSGSIEKLFPAAGECMDGCLSHAALGECSCKYEDSADHSR